MKAVKRRGIFIVNQKDNWLFSCTMNVCAHVFWPVNQFMGSKREVNRNTLAVAMDDWSH